MSESEAPSHLEAALELVSIGMYVLPLHTIRAGSCSCEDKVPNCKPGKHPMGLLVKNGVKQASNDPGTVSRWWTKEPDANIGIACGPSGLIGVDEDPRNGGRETLAGLKVDGSHLPDTVMAESGGGGHHYLYRRPDCVPVRDSSLGPGVDLKIGGYIVAAPSIHMSGARYTWLTGSDPFDGMDIAAAPDWLVEHLAGVVSEPKRTNGLVIDWTAECPPELMSAIRTHPQLRRLWEAVHPIAGQIDDTPSSFRFLLQGQLAARGFTRQQILDASIAFTKLRSEHLPSDTALLNEIHKAFNRAAALPKTAPVALRRSDDMPERAVLDAVEHSSRAMLGMPDGAKRLLLALARYSTDGETAQCPDLRLAKDLGWRTEANPKGSRQVRRYKKVLVRCGCITPLKRSAPGHPVKYGLNVRQNHPHRRTGASYE